MAGLASADVVDMCWNVAGLGSPHQRAAPARLTLRLLYAVFRRLYDLVTSDDDIEEESEPEAARAAANLSGQLPRESDRQSRKRGRSTSPAAGNGDGSAAASSPATALGTAPTNSGPAMQPQLAAAPAQEHIAAPMGSAPSPRATSQRQDTHSVAAAHTAQRPPGVQQPRHATVATTAERGATAASRPAVPMPLPRAAVVQTAQQPKPGGAGPAQRFHAASDARQQPAAASAPSSAAQVRSVCIESMSLFGDSKQGPGRSV